MNENKRILVVDDNDDIHYDIDKLLGRVGSAADKAISSLEDELFGDKASESQKPTRIEYDLSHAYQGEEAIEMVEKAEKADKPFSVILMDVRMPPGLDGVQTIHKIWQKYPRIEMVLCTAYSDYSWDEIVAKLGGNDKLFFLKKPFEPIALQQIVFTLTQKWSSGAQIEALEREVRERTEQLDQLIQELEQVKKEVAPRNTSMADFITNMSYEIRTPLQGVIGMNSLLLDSDLGTDQKAITETAKQSAESLLNVMNNILDFERIATNNINLSTAPFDIRQMIVRIRKSIKAAIQYKNLQLKVHVDDSIPGSIVGDVNRVERILFHLAENAIKFSDEGTVTINVSEEQLDENEVTLRIAVTDSGPGISEDYLPHIFDCRQRSRSEFSKKPVESRFGLFICKHLTNIMNGEMGVESTLGSGSTFWFKLSFPIAHTTPAVTVVDDSQLSCAQDIRVLIAEDNIVNQIVARRILEKEGFQVVVVSNGRKVLKELESKAYDLILMDVHMPEMDGYEATTIIREQEKGTDRHIPIIAITASIKEEARDLCIKAGMDDFIRKPVVPADLAQALKRWVTQKIAMPSS